MTSILRKFCRKGSGSFRFAARFGPGRLVDFSISTIVTVFVAVAVTPNVAASVDYTVSSQVGALAPNAGGQLAYSFRLATKNWEVGTFSNQYLLAGDLPLSGLTADWRFAICDSSCFWQAYLQLGAGFSNGGPLAQVTWSALFPLIPVWLPIETMKYVPALRIDITTQMIAIRHRAVTWSYPLWIGVAVPF